jgi:hypothetical protein
VHLALENSILPLRALNAERRPGSPDVNQILSLGTNLRPTAYGESAGDERVLLPSELLVALSFLIRSREGFGFPTVSERF